MIATFLPLFFLFCLFDLPTKDIFHFVLFLLRLRTLHHPPFFIVISFLLAFQTSTSAGIDCRNLSMPSPLLGCLFILTFQLPLPPFLSSLSVSIVCAPNHEFPLMVLPLDYQACQISCQGLLLGVLWGANFEQSCIRKLVN